MESVLSIHPILGVLNTPFSPLIPFLTMTLFLAKLVIKDSIPMQMEFVKLLWLPFPTVFIIFQILSAKLVRMDFIWLTMERDVWWILLLMKCADNLLLKPLAQFVSRDSILLWIILASSAETFLKVVLIAVLLIQMSVWCASSVIVSILLGVFISVKRMMIMMRRKCPLSSLFLKLS